MVFFNAQKLLHGDPVLGEIPSDKAIVKETLRIAWPSLIESFFVAFSGFISTIMVSSLGSAAITAVGLTTQPKFLGLAFFISLNVAVSAIVAHRKGEGDQQTAVKVMSQAIIITIALGVIVTIACVAFADPIITFAGAQSDTHADAVLYYKIVMGGMMFNIISLVINAAQRGVGNTKITMTTNLTSNFVNILLSYLLIDGNLGFPKLGITGAAVATVLGTVVAMFMSFASILRKDTYLSVRHLHKSDFRFDKRTIKSIANIGSSTLAEQLFLRIGFMMFTIVIANLGTSAFAAHQIGMNLMSLSFSFGDGLSAAAITLVGQSLGAKRTDMARIYGSVCQRTGILFSVGLSIIFLTLGRPIYLMFTNDEEIISAGVMIMTMLTAIVFLQIAQVIFSACLRGAGDTKFTALVAVISVAIIRPCLGWLFCYPFGLGLFGAWLGLTCDQFSRFILTFTRFKSGRWQHFEV